MVNKKIIFSLLFLCLLFLGCTRNEDSPSRTLDLEQLKALPYINHTTETVNQNQSGVMVYNRNLAFGGYNIYNYFSMDMEGNIVRKWKGTLINILENGDIPFFNLVFILDKGTKEIVWTWGPGEISVQHMPRMLENGNILIFDNGKHVRDYSRVIELDPVKKEVLWEYIADPPQSFFTAESGGAQRLPNENTLITESNKGRVFEVTKEGEIVWEWYSPGITEDGKRKTLYRMKRVSKDKIDKILAKEKIS